MKAKKYKTENGIATLVHCGCGIYRPCMILDNGNEMMQSNTTTNDELIDFARENFIGELHHVDVYGEVECIRTRDKGKVIADKVTHINEKNIKYFMEIDRLQKLIRDTQ